MGVRQECKTRMQNVGTRGARGARMSMGCEIRVQDIGARGVKGYERCNGVRATW